MNRVLRYFLRGLLLLAPVTLTVYLIVSLFDWLNSLFDMGVPGLGILTVAFLITLVGWIGSSLFAKPILHLVEKTLKKIPLISIIYTALKDLMSAFVGDSQKFNRPVLVRIISNSEVYKLGFITQENMAAIGHPDLLAVYLPDSYSLSGELYLVPGTNVSAVDKASTEVMKFIVSGGVSRM
jgi:uncharacterized membrane protein